MRKLLSASAMLATFAGFAQQTTLDVGKQDVNVSTNMFYSIAGSPVSSAKYVRLVDGSPYFREEWLDGAIELADGKRYQNVRLKLDLTDNSLLFLDADSNEMIATASVRSVTLADNHAGKEYTFIFSSFIKSPGNLEKGWYQVLGEGTAGIYKQIIKNIKEVKPYGSATTEQTIETTSKYFLITGTSLSLIKKFKDIPGLLADKKDDLNKYLNSMKLTGKFDADYSDLITYYNQITK